MKENVHTFQTSIEWIGNTGEGTKDYDSYSREHLVKCPAKEDIMCSSHPQFRGSEYFHNPEDLFVSSIASCHMLWYLSLCSKNGIVVEEYRDDAEGVLELDDSNSGKITTVNINPIVIIKNKEKKDLAKSLHMEAHQKCFIANSCTCKIHINSSIY